MAGLLSLGLIIVVLAALDAAAVRWGADSRFGAADTRRPGEALGPVSAR